ncbi:MAG: lipoxygenase family protein [Pirellula sp.]
MTAFLPQQDSGFIRFLRQCQCWLNRSRYRYNYDHVPGLALLAQVHLEDEPKLEWVEQVAARMEFLLKNQLQVAEHDVVKGTAQQKLNELAEAREAETVLRRVVGQALQLGGIGVSQSVHASSMADFKSIFRGVKLPAVAANYRGDVEFGLKRLMGPNPVMIRQVSRFPDKFPVRQEHFQRALGALVANHQDALNPSNRSVQQPSWLSVCMSDSLERAGAEGRLFMLDYEEFQGVEQGSFPHGRKYLYAPMALFVSSLGGGPLLPLAIQCEQTPSKTNPIFTPADGNAWLLAKTIVDIADGNYHEAGTHLGKTHLIMEPFVMSSLRNLAWRHPLAQLLAPHFEGTLAINDMAWKHLISDAGAVDRLMGGSIAASRGLAAKTVQGMSIQGSLLPRTFADRGVSDCDRLPNYAYRDDSQLYWDTISKWVRAYLDIYYRNDQDVQADYELKAWIGELTSREGGRVQGLPRAEGLTKVNLAEVVTFVMYTCSVQHAAVNFPQYDHMSYTPNMPLAGYRPAPSSVDEQLDESDYYAMLPPLDMVELQMSLGYLLGTVHYTQLGQYARDHFKDPRVSEPMKQFQRDLVGIGELIQQRNLVRPNYETLLPQGVPQSINI